MEVGSLEIGGSIDTAEIERGLNSIERGFDDVTISGKSVESDFIRINSSAMSLAKSLGIIGGITALVSLAKGAPAVAGEMAQLEVAAGKLQRSLGEALKPAFQGAVDAMNIFGGWIEENKELISSFATQTLEALNIVLGSIVGLWRDLSGIELPVLDITIGEGLKWLVDTFGSTIIAGFLGFKLGGPVGAAIGAMVAATSQEGILGQEAMIGAAIGTTAGIPLGPFGMLGGAALGSVVGLLTGAILDALNRRNATTNAADME